MKVISVQLIDQNEEACGTLLVPLIRTTHVKRAIEERLLGETILKIVKTSDGWIAQVEL